MKKLASLTILCFTICMLEPNNMVLSAEINIQAKNSTDKETNDPKYREIVYGAEDAPVTIIEYASLTCNHCATFHNVVFPEIKKNYIDTGKVRFVFRDFPLDGLAMAGAMLARCAPKGRNKALLKIMFKNQTTWAMSKTPIEPLRRYAKLAGMSSDTVDACLRNESIISGIRTAQETADRNHEINATPTFLIEGTKIDGGRDYQFMADLIEKKLNAKN